MPHEASLFGDQSEESEEFFQISPHCTWCALYAIRLQERGQQQSDGQGNSGTSMGGARKLMSSRRKAKKLAACDSDRDSSDDESLSEKESTAQCGKYWPREKCSHVRNSCLWCRSEAKAKTAGCQSPGAELLKTCEEDKRECDHQLENTAGARVNFRQIVMESRCPCLCAYLHFTDTADACTCVRRSPASSTPDRDGKTPANAPDDRTRSPSAPRDKNRFGCCVARYFSAFRKRSKLSSRDANTHQPSPLSLQQKNSVPAGDSAIAKDMYCHNHQHRCSRCQSSCKTCEMLKSDVLRKPSKRESFLSAGVQEDADAHTAHRTSTEIMGKDSCLKCRRARYGLEDAEKVLSCVRCTCDCASRNKDIKNFQRSFQRIYRALSGCKRSTCTCDCHGKQSEEKNNANDTRVPSEEENRRSKRLNGRGSKKTSLPKRGLLALKYEIFKCKELGGDTKERESSSSVCEWNQRDCQCLKRSPETKHKCSCKEARESERKTDKSCVSEEKKCSRKACLDERKQPRQLDTYKSKKDPCGRQGGTVPKENIVLGDDEMVINHKYPKEKAKQKRCINRRSKVTNAQSLHERDLSGRSADDSSDESELELRKNMTRKVHEVKTNPKGSKEEHNDDNFLSEPNLDPISAEVIKIGNRYYQAVRHRTAHVNIMSFKNLKERGEARRRGNHKKSPRIEVRLKYDTTSSEEDASEAPEPSIGPLGDSPCHRPNLQKRKVTKRRTATDKIAKKGVGSDTKEAKLISKKRQHVPHSTGATDGPTPPVTRKHSTVREADWKVSSRELLCGEKVERLPKAMTDPPTEKGESPRGWKSEGAQLKTKGMSARTLELKQMSEKWFASDAKQWCSGQVDLAGDTFDSGTCDVRPFTASSSAS